MPPLNSSFLYAGGPGVIICTIFCFAPYFCYSHNWQVPTANDPINHGLQSLYFQYTLVATVAASTPPLIEITADMIYSRGNLSSRTFIIFSVLFCLIFPELITLIFISSQSNAKLYICSHNASITVYLFLGCMLLCQCGQKFWRTKWCAFSATCIYIGFAILTFPPYFVASLQLFFYLLGSFFHLVGCSVFLVLAYKFLNTKLPDDRNNGHVIADDLICRFTTIFIVGVIIGRFTLLLASGLPYWTDFTGVYISLDAFIVCAPSIGMCFVLSRATKNEAYFMQNVRQKFVRHISHEMRTPLNTAVMGLQYLRGELVKSSTDTDLLGIVDEVRGACEISVTILNEMLDYDKLQSGLMNLEKETVNVKKFLETTLSPFHSQANQKGVNLQIDLNNVTLESLQIEVDINKFAQVIRNLISNGLKFTPVGGTVKLVTTVLENQASTVTATIIPNVNKLLRIDVIDSGVGVSKANQHRLFKEIVQFNPGKLQNGGGSGLGLYISKGIMDLHQGDLTIASEGEGYGCTFTVTIQAKYMRPFEPSEVSEFKEKESSSTNRSSQSRSSLRFLLPIFDGLNLRSSFTSLRISPKETTDSEAVAALAAGRRFLEQCGDRCRSYSEEAAECSVHQLPPLPPPPLYKILVVDDSSSNRKMLIRLLKDKCSGIAEAVDGLEALNKMKEALALDKERKGNSAHSSTTSSYQKFKYDAVLMDFIMPNMEGPEAAKCMREAGYTGLIIGITGNMLPVDKEWYRSQGADIVLTKPVNILEIERALQLIKK